MSRWCPYFEKYCLLLLHAFMFDVYHTRAHSSFLCTPPGFLPLWICWPVKVQPWFLLTLENRTYNLAADAQSLHPANPAALEGCRLGCVCTWVPPCISAFSASRLLTKLVREQQTKTLGEHPPEEPNQHTHTCVCAHGCASICSITQTLVMKQNQVRIKWSTDGARAHACACLWSRSITTNNISVLIIM